MMEKLKKAFSWLGSQVEAGIDWLRDNWPATQAQAEKVAGRLYEVALSHIRKVVLCFNRGVVTAIETAMRREMLPFHQAWAEARAVVKAMTGEEVCAYVAYWFHQEEAAAVVV
jgi:hypothetical protein